MGHWRKPRGGDLEMRTTLLAVFGTPLVVGLIALVAVLVNIR